MLTRTQVLFPNDMLELLRLEAASKRISLSKLVRGIVAEKVGKIRNRKLTAHEAMSNMIKRAHQAKGQKAPRDLSTNDEYLYRLP